MKTAEKILDDLDETYYVEEIAMVSYYTAVKAIEHAQKEAHLSLLHDLIKILIDVSKQIPPEYYDVVNKHLINLQNTAIKLTE